MSGLVEFDLGPLAAAYSASQIRFKRAQAGGAIGVGLILLGIWAVSDLRLAHPPLVPSNLLSTVLLIGLGVAAIGGLLIVAQSPAAVRISIDGDGFRLWARSGRVFIVKWADPRARISITDCRQVKGKLPGLRGIDFLMMTQAPLDVPLPIDAVHALTSVASRAGRVVTGWNDTTSETTSGRVIRLKLPAKRADVAHL